MRCSIRFSYDGADFFGWQRQNDVRTVQGEIEKALSTFLRDSISVTGAGRTDTGVNAVNYIAHFEMSDGKILLDAETLLYKINAILPKTITVHEICPARDDFHARFSASSREYHYFLHRRKDPFMGRFSWYCRYPIDLGRMNEAASYLTGRHDFRCFEKTGGSNLTSVCTVYKAGWETWTPPHVALLGYPYSEGDFLVFHIRADRFLRNMVRAIVGTLVDIGRGRHEPEWMGQLIREGTRSDAGESVPGNALFLNEVRYPEPDDAGHGA